MQLKYKKHFSSKMKSLYVINKKNIATVKDKTSRILLASDFVTCTALYMLGFLFQLNRL